MGLEHIFQPHFENRTLVSYSYFALAEGASLWVYRSQEGKEAGKKSLDPILDFVLSSDM